MIYDNEVEILLVEDNMSDAELTSGPWRKIAWPINSFI